MQGFSRGDAEARRAETKDEVRDARCEMAGSKGGGRIGKGKEKPRVVSLSLAPAAVAMGDPEENALRVRLVSLHRVIPPYTGGPSIPFTAFEGQVRYVGPPAVYIESSSSGASKYGKICRRFIFCNCI